MQTPLGIIQSKLDRLSQMDVSEDMARYIVEAKSGVERLNKMNKSLLLLAKLDNKAFEGKQSIRFQKSLQQHLQMMEDLFAAKHIKINTRLVQTTLVSDLIYVKYLYQTCSRMRSIIRTRVVC